MKVLQILDKLPDGGGTAAHVTQISDQLRADGHDIDILRLLDDADQSPEEPAEFAIPSSYDHLQGMLRRRDLHNVIKTSMPDLIHIHGCFTAISPVLVSYMTRHWPVIGTMHDIHPFCYSMTRRFTPSGEICQRSCGLGCFTSMCVRVGGAVDAMRMFRRYLVAQSMLSAWRKMHRVIVPSRYMFELAQLHDFSKEKLRLIPHGTRMPVIPAQDNHKASPALVLFVGSLLEYKGIEHFLEALQLIKEKSWQAEVIGDGPLRERIAEKISRMGLQQRIQVTGHLDNRELLESKFARASIVVIPTLIPESFSLTGIESLVLRTPVVSYGLGGISEWLRDGENGLIARDGDYRDLAIKIGMLLDNPDSALDMGSKGSEMVKTNFTLELSMQRLISVYRECSS